MTYILSIETATKVSSVALHRQGVLIAEYENLVERSHAESITEAIKDVLQKGGIDVSQLSAMAVSKGPGSYTGLRIGVSIAKGLCYGNDIPLIAIETLKSMALEVTSGYRVEGVICPMIDARRMEVYCQLLDSELHPLSDIEAKIIDEESFSSWVEKGKFFFFGDGAGKCGEILTHENYVFIGDIYPKAKFIGELAQHKYLDKEFENLAYFEPYYLKEFVAKKPSGKNLV